MGMRKMHKKTTNQDINNLIQHAIKMHINQKPAKIKKATQNPKTNRRNGNKDKDT